MNEPARLLPSGPIRSTWNCEAIDIAACQLATSLYLPVAQGRTARNTYLGHSASLGLQAAFASAAGIDAPEGALAHYAANHAEATAQPLPDASTLLLRDAYLKPFAAVRHVHYGATAARAAQDCELNGQPVNPANGGETARKTGVLRCKDRGSGQLLRE